MTGPGPVPPEGLDVGLLLFIPYRAMETRVFQALAAAGFDDFTPAQARVMQRIGPEGTRLTELAEAAQVTKQTAGSLVDQLERAGYVRRTPDPSDARARLVRVAERGTAAQPVAEAAVARVEAEWRAHLGDRRWQQLRQALELLREVTDPQSRRSGGGPGQAGGATCRELPAEGGEVIRTSGEVSSRAKTDSTS